MEHERWDDGNMCWIESVIILLGDCSLVYEIISKLLLTPRKFKKIIFPSPIINGGAWAFIPSLEGASLAWSEHARFLTKCPILTRLV